MNNFSHLSIRFSVETNKLEALDQTLLPTTEKWIHVDSVSTCWKLIKSLSVRGAPLIGVCAAMTLAVTSKNSTRSQLIEDAKYLITARPTAVNLMYCCNMIIQAVEKLSNDLNLSKTVCELAEKMRLDEIRMCDRMSEFGATLVNKGDFILTHCNTGEIATPGKGTALGIIKLAHSQDKQIHVFVDETRPLLQGARLTTYELDQLKIPFTLICDNMAAMLMRQNKVSKVFVGSDRIAANGDFANKIGTYGLAVLAHFHKVPFYVVAPQSTVDLSCPNGDAIPIEERAKEEVRGASGAFGKVEWSPQNCQTFNPAFDVTPIELVTAIILDSGIYPREEVQKGALLRLQK